MNDSAQLAWKKEKAGIEYAKRIALRPLQLGYAPIYHRNFFLYLRWVLARIPTSYRPFPSPLTEDLGLDDSSAVRLREYFSRESIDVTEVWAFLENLLGEDFEAIFGCKADANDYKHVAYTLQREVSHLNPLPDTVAEAFVWLEQRLLQFAHSIPTPSIAPIGTVRISEEEPTPVFPAFRWTGKKVELAELGYALVCSGLVETTNREHFVQALSDFFDTSISAPANTIGKAKGSRKSRGAIFDKLKRALDNYLES